MVSPAGATLRFFFAPWGGVDPLTNVVLILGIDLVQKSFPFLIAVLALAVWATSGQAAGHNWMAALGDDKYLHELSIPGTHDSGALVDGLYRGTAKCQNLTIHQQLNAGVRFLDIRCRHLNDAFVIHHGQVYQKLNFTDVLNAVSGFLGANPNETVLMSVKEEYDAEGNTRTFAETFTTYVNNNPSLWYLGASVPKLGDVRGKIVLLRRFNESPYPTGRGINADGNGWPDDTTATIVGPPEIRVQDVYKVWDRGNKWGYITSLFDEMPANPSALYLNYTSGYSPWDFGIPNIPAVASYINFRLKNFFTSAPTRRYGVVIADFITTELAELIYKTNFGSPAAPMLSISSATVPENSPLGTEVGNFTYTPTVANVEPGTGLVFVAGPGSGDNSRFRIDSATGRLRTAAPLNHEAKSVYSIRVRQGSTGLVQPFTITVTGVNEAPTDIRVGQTVVLRGSVEGEADVMTTTRATLRTADPDAGDTFTYTLVAGRGDKDNYRFTVVGDIVVTDEVTDAVTGRVPTLPVRRSYSIRVRATDADGLSVERPLVIKPSSTPSPRTKPSPSM